MLRGSKSGAWTLALATLVGCDSPVVTPGLVVRDSAGVRIVETTATQRVAAPFKLASEASFAVGVVEGDPAYLLSRVAGAMQLQNGDVLVANGGTNELRFFGPDGTFLRTEGREGQGPGEYEYIRGLGRCRRSGFVAFDLNWQMNAYDAEGRFLEKTVLRAPSGITPYNLACDADGHFLILGWGRQATEGPRIGFYEARDHLVLASTGGEIAADFGEQLVSERIGSAGGSGPHPAGRATVFALHNEQVYMGSGERFEVEVRRLDGGVASLLRGPLISLELTDSIKSAYLEARVQRVGPERRAAVRREVESLEWPSSVPAYTDLRVDPEGIVWLKAYRVSSEEPERWSLLAPDRGYLGDLTFSKGRTLLEIGADYVLLLQRDDLDVESVVKLTLDRGNDS